MFKTVRQEYAKLTHAQQRAIYWTFYIIGSELSKLIILFIIFSLLGKQLEFILTAIILLPIRCNAGGLHLQTYWGCLIATILFFLCAIVPLPILFPINVQLALSLLLLCAILNTCLGPVINPTRPSLSASQIKKSRICITLTFLLYGIILLVTRNVEKWSCCIWILVLQTIQLILAKCKGDNHHVK